jgi:SAM-dependent methyltransferase
VTLHEGVAEAMPFPDRSFDCVVSNNGYNNVSDRAQSLRETARVCRPGAQLVFTMNLEGSFRELHEEWQGVLQDQGQGAALPALRDFIASRRPPVGDVLSSVVEAGFAIEQAAHDEFAFRFADAGALFAHAFFRTFQIPPLREIVPKEAREAAWAELHRRLDGKARPLGELRLSVPFVTVSARRT